LQSRGQAGLKRRALLAGAASATLTLNQKLARAGEVIE